MTVRIFVTAGIVAGTLLMLLAWLIPTWPYDWVPPNGALKDADLAYFDVLAASASILILAAASLLNLKAAMGGFRRVAFVILATVSAFAAARLALLLFSSRPWPDFR